MHELLLSCSLFVKILINSGAIDVGEVNLKNLKASYPYLADIIAFLKLSTKRCEEIMMGFWRIKDYLNVINVHTMLE